MSNVLEIEGKKYVALRSAIEQMNGKVVWDNSQKQATVELNGNTTVATMADENAVVDGKIITLSAAPRVHEGTLYVPEDFFPAILNAQFPF